MKSAGKGKLKKIIIWAVVGLAVILFVVIPIFGPLNPLEVMLLRIKYPVYNPLALKDPTIDLIGTLGVESAVKSSESVLHIKVTGDEKFYCAAEVIEDASGKFKPGEAIWAKTSMDMDGVYPHLQQGNEYLVMGGYGGERRDQPIFNVNSYGIFYVTFSGHALASSEEGSLSLSGNKADVCMDTVYQLIQEKEEERETLEATEE